MKNILDYDGFIFDLDGTLLDSMGMWEKIYEDALLGLKITPPENYLMKVNHLSVIDGARYTIKEYGITSIDENGLIKIWQDMSQNKYENEVKLKENTAEIIQYLYSKGKTLGIATATSRHMFEPCLKRLKIDKYFTSTVSIDEVARGKDYPDIYDKCAKKMGTIADNTVVFEDSIVGIKSAKSGGYSTIGVWDKSADNNVEIMKKTADKYIYSFMELLPDEKSR